MLSPDRARIPERTKTERARSAARPERDDYAASIST
jgi:hypothetical protein